VSEVVKWLRGPVARPEVEIQLAALAFDRVRVF
jgi:hypothetical protein